MDQLNLTDENIAIITAGLVASIRKKYPVVDGLLRVSITIFVISLIACSVRQLGGDATLNVSVILPLLIRSLWIAILALAGVNVLSYLLEKIGNGKNGIGDNKT